jgi:hypothetical protein
MNDWCNLERSVKFKATTEYKDVSIKKGTLLSISLTCNEWSNSDFGAIDGTGKGNVIAKEAGIVLSNKLEPCGSITCTPTA